GASALVTMPLDTVKTRIQVMETDGAAWRGRRSRARCAACSRKAGGRRATEGSGRGGDPCRLGGHHGHHLRVLEAALGQGRVSRLEVSLI
ncbi:hypothetical protein EE612_015622, partial [Oryza sativa]